MVELELKLGEQRSSNLLLPFSQIGDRHVLLDDKELEAIGDGCGLNGPSRTRRSAKKGRGKGKGVGPAAPAAKPAVSPEAEVEAGARDKGADAGVDRGSIAGGALRKPVRRAALQPEAPKPRRGASEGDKDNAKSGEADAASPLALLLEVGPCSFPQQLNGFAKAPAATAASPKAAPAPAKKKRSGERGGARGSGAGAVGPKKPPAPFKPKKIDRVAAYHKVEDARRQDGRRMRALRKSVSA